MTGGTVYYDDVGIDSEASACFYPALMSHWVSDDPRYREAIADKMWTQSLS